MENADLTRIWFLKHIHILCKHGDLIPPMMRKMRIHSRQNIGKHMGFWWDFAMAITHPRALPARNWGGRHLETGRLFDHFCLHYRPLLWFGLFRVGVYPQIQMASFCSVGNEKPLEFRWFFFTDIFPNNLQIITNNLQIITCLMYIFPNNSNVSFPSLGLEVYQLLAPDSAGLGSQLPCVAVWLMCRHVLSVYTVDVITYISKYRYIHSLFYGRYDTSLNTTSKEMKCIHIYV